jgi:hypothetical protein
MQRCHFPMATRTSTVSERAEIPLMSPIFSSELPASVAPTSRDAPFVCLAPKRLFLTTQKVRCARSCHENAEPCTDALRRGAA